MRSIKGQSIYARNIINASVNSALSKVRGAVYGGTSPTQRYDVVDKRKQAIICGKSKCGGDEIVKF